MANYNHGHHLMESLGAIAVEADADTEIIVVDDGSTDESVAILERLRATVSNLVVLRNDRNRGTLDAINRAIEISRGEYLCFCSADDRVLPGCFRESMTMLQTHRGAAACTAPVRVIGPEDDDQGVFQMVRIASANGFISSSLAAKILHRDDSWYVGPAAMFRRDAFLAAGGLRRELGIVSDQFVFMVLALRHGVCYIPSPLAVMRRAEGTCTSVMSKQRERMLKIVAEAGALMRTTYADLFSESLARRLEGRWLFYIHGRALAPPPPAGRLRVVSWTACRWIALLRLFLRYRAADTASVLRRRLVRVLVEGSAGE